VLLSNFQWPKPASVTRKKHQPLNQSADRSEVRQYQRDTRGMSEDEEWDYVTKKYEGEIRWEEEESGSNDEK
jgi:hypothetical protein